MNTFLFSISNWQISLSFTFIVILNQIPRHSCAAWCSWLASTQCKIDLNNQCWTFRTRVCECPSATGMSDTCYGAGEERTRIKCSSYRGQCSFWIPLLSDSPWCQWNEWSEWNSLDVCVNNQGIQQRVRRRQCKCATSWSSNFCFPDFKVEYSNRTEFSDNCAALNWCDWSEWDGCTGSCPIKTQSRSRTCGCGFVKGSFSQCLGGYFLSTQTRNCSNSSCYDGGTFSWIFSHGTLIGGFFVVATISVIIFFIRIIYYKRYQRRLHQRRVFGTQAGGVISLTSTVGSVDVLGNSSNHGPLTANVSYPRQAMVAVEAAAPQHISAEYINEGFYPYLAPPPYCPPTADFVTTNESQPPSYDECFKMTTVEPSAPSVNQSGTSTTVNASNDIL